MAIPDPATTDWVPIWNPNQTIPTYQEGTWLPTLICDGGGTATYSIQGGVFTKIGNVVICNFDVAVATVTWTAGTITVGNFPFVSTSSLPTAGTIGFYIITGAVYNVHLYMLAGFNRAQLPYKNALSASPDGNLQAGNFGAGSRVIGSVTYRVA